MRHSLPLVLLLAVTVRADDPDWVGPMKEVHARFKGTPGTLSTMPGMGIMSHDSRTT
jgi:hypothetical protein